MTMKVLLTGGAGYIGSHTCIALLEAGYEIVVIDNYCNSKPEAMERVTRLTGKRFPIYHADVRDAAAMDKVFSEHVIDAVIHFAGLKAVGESTEMPLMYYRVNLDASLTLAEVMMKHGVKNLVFSSSATVYGKIDHSPIPEDVELGCESPYGWTKFMIEQIFTDTAAANPDWSVALMRYFNPVGAHESGLIGENPNGIPNNLMPRAINAAFGQGALEIYGDDYPTPDGTCVRDYIHVMDLADGHLKALEYVAAHTGAQAFNLGTGVGYSVKDIVRGVEEAAGRPVPRSIAPRRPGDVPSYYADAGKALKLLHWRATRTLEDMCRDSWRFKRQNPNGYDS